MSQSERDSKKHGIISISRHYPTQHPPDTSPASRSHFKIVFLLLSFGDWKSSRNRRKSSNTQSTTKCTNTYSKRDSKILLASSNLSSSQDSIEIMELYLNQFTWDWKRFSYSYTEVSAGVYLASQTASDTQVS